MKHAQTAFEETLAQWEEMELRIPSSIWDEISQKIDLHVSLGWLACAFGPYAVPMAEKIALDLAGWGYAAQTYGQVPTSDGTAGCWVRVTWKYPPEKTNVFS